MYVTSCYILLIAITIFVVLMIPKLYRRSNSLIPIVPIIIIYFWSIYGAWTWIPFKLSGGRYFYEDLMFTINIDEYYFLSLLYYSIFLIIFCISELLLINNSKINYREHYLTVIEKLSSSAGYHIVVVILLVIFLSFSFRDISLAMKTGVSAYGLSRFESTLGGLNSFVMFCGDTFVYLSIPLFFSNSKKKKIPVILLFDIYYMFNFILGNRNVLLCGLVAIVLLYTELNGVKKALKIKNIIIALVFLLSIQLISFYRGMSMEVMFTRNDDISLSDIFMSLFSSSEFYAGQMSMYGVLKYNVDFTWGSSVLFLISTLLPTFLGFTRPDSIYLYYVKGTVGHRPDFGVTINHATGWYLNFGIIGIILGAWMWAAVLNYFIKRKQKFLYLYGAILFSSVSIQMIRSGMEAYKGVLLLDTLIPMLIIWWFGARASNKVRNNSKIVVAKGHL